MKKLFGLLTFTLSGLYLITHNEYIRIFLTASIISYLLILIHLISTCMYGLIKTIIKNGLTETFTELEFQLDESKKERQEAETKKQERKNNIEKILNIKFYF